MGVEAASGAEAPKAITGTYKHALEVAADQGKPLLMDFYTDWCPHCKELDAEARWIRKTHPGWRKGGQALLGDKGKSYDRIEYATPDGKTKTIFFDITDFFGK